MIRLNHRWFSWSARCSRLYRINDNKHMTLNTNLPFHIYINRTNNRLVYNIKDEYKLQTRYPELLRLFSSTKKLIKKQKMEKMYRV